MSLPYRWWWFRTYTIRRVPHNLAWWIAWHLPRYVVLMCLVRLVAGVTDSHEHPDTHTYGELYRRWEAGKGR